MILNTSFRGSFVIKSLFITLIWSLNFSMADLFSAPLSKRLCLVCSGGSAVNRTFPRAKTVIALSIKSESLFFSAAEYAAAASFEEGPKGF